MSSSKGSLTVLDYVIFALLLAVSAFVGMYYYFTDKKKTIKEYFLTNRKMPVPPVAFSLMATFMSGVSVLGLAAENYLHGSQFMMTLLGYVLASPVAAFVILPVFFNMQATSAFEYLEKRFCKEARLLASSIFIVQMVLFMSVALYAPAIALNAVTGISKWTWVMLAGVVCTFYSSIGGMRAVIWTDLFQALLMYSGVLAVCIKGTLDVGGFSEVWRIADEGARIQFFNFDPDPTVRHTFWTLVCGGFFTYLGAVGVNQASVQRLLTVKSLKESQIASFLFVPMLVFFSLMSSFAGLVTYANLSKCDPLLRSRETNIQKADQILPYFVMTSLAVVPGLPGLFVAGVFSASLSSISSAINSLAAVTVEDFLYPIIFRRTPENRIKFFTKLIALLYGTLCILLTLVVDKIGGILQLTMVILNVFGGSMLGIFSLGMLLRRTTAKGAITGFLVSLCLSSFIGISGMMSQQKIPSYHRSVDGCPLNSSGVISKFPDTTYANQTGLGNWTTSRQNKEGYVFPLLKLSYMWYAGFGFITCFSVGYCTSLIWGKKEYVNPLLLSPMTRLWNLEKDPKPEALPMEEST